MQAKEEDEEREKQRRQKQIALPSRCMPVSPPQVLNHNKIMTSLFLRPCPKCSSLSVHDGAAKLRKLHGNNLQRPHLAVSSSSSFSSSFCLFIFFHLISLLPALPSPPYPSLFSFLSRQCLPNLFCSFPSSRIHPRPVSLCPRFAYFPVSFVSSFLWLSFLISCTFL